MTYELTYEASRRRAGQLHDELRALSRSRTRPDCQQRHFAKITGEDDQFALLAATDRCRSETLGRVPQQPTTRSTWTEAEQRAFLTAAVNDRLHAAWLLTSYGLRRSEVCGLRWSYIDLEASTLTIAR